MHLSVNYDVIADEYDRRYQRNDYSGVESALIAFAGQDDSAKVLEIGCGTGHWLRVLEERGMSTAGLDASIRMLAYARTRVRGLLAHGVADCLPFAAESFDRLFCINAFHHFRHKQRFLAEAKRVLRPGGQFMTIGLDPHTGIDRWYVYDYFEPALESDKQRYVATSQIRDWMAAAGFVDCVTREVQHIPARLAARTALEEGRLAKTAGSQLALLTDEQYECGIDRIRRDSEAAEARGDSSYLIADLRLYATWGST
jgi:ubiquinone/menaquinone biosynthesis C-methylase UbiE